MHFFEKKTCQNGFSHVKAALADAVNAKVAGHIAQRESIGLTSRGSQVQTLLCPLIFENKISNLPTWGGS